MSNETAAIHYSAPVDAAVEWASEDAQVAFVSAVAEATAIGPVVIRGPQGVQGIQGPTGPQGPSGSLEAGFIIDGGNF